MDDFVIILLVLGFFVSLLVSYFESVHVIQTTKPMSVLSSIPTHELENDESFDGGQHDEFPLDFVVEVSDENYCLETLKLLQEYMDECRWMSVKGLYLEYVRNCASDYYRDKAPFEQYIDQFEIKHFEDESETRYRESLTKQTHQNTLHNKSRKLGDTTAAAAAIVMEDISSKSSSSKKVRFQASVK